MYKIAILDKDEAYLERLVSFLQEHHRESFEISAANSLDELDMDVTQCNALFFGDDVVVDAALFPRISRSGISRRKVRRARSMSTSIRVWNRYTCGW